MTHEQLRLLRSLEQQVIALARRVEELERTTDNGKTKRQRTPSDDRARGA